MRDKISVLLVDDHALVRRGFRRILEDERDITVVGEASDGAEAIRLAQELRPQVIVMDCAMPGVNGLQATRQILEKQPQALVLMLSMHSGDLYVNGSLKAGASGYLNKESAPEELLTAIRAVLAGQTYISESLQERRSNP